MFTKENGGASMQVKMSNKGTNLIVSLIGEIDHHSAELIRNKVDSEIVKATTKNVLMDFSKVSFMDSSGIGVVVGRYKSIVQLKGNLYIINPSIQIRKIFEMSGINKMVPIYDTIDIAMQNIAQNIAG